MSNCRACKASIQWITTPAGKKLPLDSKPTRMWVQHPTSGIWNFRECFTPHHATCPQADSFRKKEGTKPKDEKQAKDPHSITLEMYKQLDLDAVQSAYRYDVQCLGDTVVLVGTHGRPRRPLILDKEVICLRPDLASFDQIVSNFVDYLKSKHPGEWTGFACKVFKLENPIRLQLLYGVAMKETPSE